MSPHEMSQLVAILVLVFLGIGWYGLVLVENLGKKKSGDYTPAERVQLVFGTVLIVSSFTFFVRGLYLLWPGLF